MATGSFEGHSPLALFVIILIGLVAAAVLTVHGCTALARRGVRASEPAVVLRCTAAFAAAAAVAVYVWGALHLVLLDGTRRDEACKRAVGTAFSTDIDGYRPSYIPLRLECHVAGHGTYSAGVPAYVDPTATVLVAVAVVLALVAALASERRAREVTRTETRKETEKR